MVDPGAKTHRYLIIAGRLLLTWALLNAAALFSGETLGRHLVPFYRAVLAGASKHYEVTSLRVAQVGPDTAFSLQVRTAGARVIGQTTVPDGLPLSSSTLLGHALQPMIVLYAVLLAWPVPRLRQRCLLLVVSLPCLVVLECLDVPLVLLGALEDLMLYNLDPEALADSLLVKWMDIMNSGGRLALALVGAGVTIGMADKLDLFSRQPYAPAPGGDAGGP